MSVTVHAGDCIEVLASLPECSVDAVVTDPPYHFASIVKRFGNSKPENEKFAVNNPTVAYRRASTGFMGKQWDGGQIAHDPATWRAVARVMKPGAHLVAFHAPKNWHRQAVAIEDAGLEIRDNILWLFGSGFPKSHNLKEEWQGYGTALKPAYEPIVLARKPPIGTVAANVLKHGTGAINIDGCRVGVPIEKRDGGLHRGSGSTVGSFTGKHIIDQAPSARWPANIVHDGSAEVLAGFPESDGSFIDKPSTTGNMLSGYNGKLGGDRPPRGFDDSGSAARFFYTAKADADDRIGSRHPTVKPLDLMQWLVRLVTPPRGVILDPFAGTGTTGEAALREGFSAILIEREAEYLADIERRMAMAMEGEMVRSVAMAKLKDEGEPLPLFEWVSS